MLFSELKCSSVCLLLDQAAKIGLHVRGLVSGVQTPKHPQPFPGAVMVLEEPKERFRCSRGKFASEEVKMWG
jgi:hypothetical protein